MIRKHNWVVSVENERSGGDDDGGHGGGDERGWLRTTLKILVVVKKTSREKEKPLSLEIFFLLLTSNVQCPTTAEQITVARSFQ